MNTHWNAVLSVIDEALVIYDHVQTDDALSHSNVIERENLKSKPLHG
jgi:hypothetical protein